MLKETGIGIATVVTLMVAGGGGQKPKTPEMPTVNCGTHFVWNAQKKLCEPKKTPPQTTQPQPQTQPQTPPQTIGGDWCEKYPQDFACQHKK